MLSYLQIAPGHNEAPTINNIKLSGDSPALVDVDKIDKNYTLAPG